MTATLNLAKMTTLRDADNTGDNDDGDVRPRDADTTIDGGDT
jgi:hypothetical protein